VALLRGQPKGAQQVNGIDDGLVGELVAKASSATALLYAAMFTYVESGAPAALSLAERAVAKNGECVDCLDFLAWLRHALHDDPGAIEAERRAVAAWPREGAPTRLLRRLHQLEKDAAHPRP
jgi:hypothetical protein